MWSLEMVSCLQAEVFAVFLLCASSPLFCNQHESSSNISIEK
ncbi:hypothetical protein X975_11553, partial [Stegodyphus mimosarum]